MREDRQAVCTIDGELLPHKNFAGPLYGTRFAQYNKPTEGYITADGNTIRFPFRLCSGELMVYGTADAAKLWANQVLGELNDPVLVGGKDQKLSLPYDPHMTLFVADPKALMFVLRVILSDNDTNPCVGQKRIFASWSEAFLAQAQAHLLPHRQHLRRSVPVR